MPLMSLAALMLLADSAPVVVRVADRPAPGRCQPTDPLAETLRRRLPGLRVLSGEGAGQHDLEISLAPAPAGWRLDVRRADHLGTLTRDVPVGPGGCIDVVETSALIVERYLREIRWSGRPLALGDVGGDEPELRATPPSPPPHDAPAFRRTRIAVGLGSLVASAGDLAPTASLEVSIRLGRQMQLTAMFLASGGQQVPVEIQGSTRGSLNSRALVGWLGMGLCRPPSRLSLCAGLTGGAAALVGSAAGDVYRTRAGLALAPIVGGYGAAGYSFGSLEVTGELAAVVPLRSAALEVEGTSARHATPAIYGIAALRVGWRF